MAAVLSESALRRAETVFERMRRLGPSDRTGDGADAASPVLAPWRRAVAEDDAPAFARRLAWDDIPVSRARAAVAGAEGGPAPTLDPVCERWLGAVAAWPRAESRPIPVRPGDEIVFAALLEPWVEVAEARLRREEPRWLALLTPAARSAWSTSLLRRLGWLAALPLYSRFARVRAVDGEAGVYARWVDAELASGSSGYLEEFPVLARQLAGRDHPPARALPRAACAADHRSRKRPADGSVPGRSPKASCSSRAARPDATSADRAASSAPAKSVRTSSLVAGRSQMASASAAARALAGSLARRSSSDATGRERQRFECGPIDRESGVAFAEGLRNQLPIAEPRPAIRDAPRTCSTGTLRAPPAAPRAAGPS